MNDEQRPVEWKVISAGAMLTLSGSAIYFLIPIYLGSMMEALSLNPAQAGILSGGEYYAIAITSLLGPFWIHRFNWRRLALFGALMAGIGHAATMMLDSFPLIVLARIFTGLLGEGILYSLSFAVLGEIREPSRGFGIAMAVSITVTSVVIYFSPVLFDLFNQNGILMVLLGLAVFMCAFIAWIPASSEKARQTAHADIEKRSTRHTRWIPLFGLGSLALWFVGPGGFWAFAERMADLQGISAQRIALGFSLANGIGVTGPLLATWIGSRFGQNIPAISATLIMVLLVWLYCGNFTSDEFTIYVILYSAIWSFGSVYFFAFIAAIDWSGRLNVLTPGFQTIGLGAGPVIMGYLVNSYSYAAIGWSHGMFSLIGLLLFVPIAMGFSGNTRSAPSTNTYSSSRISLDNPPKPF